MLFCWVYIENSRRHGLCLFFSRRVCRFCGRLVHQAQETATEGAVFSRPGLRAGAAFHRSEVPHCPRAGAASLNAAPHRDPGQDMVPEQALQEQAAAVGAGAPLSKELQGAKGLHGPRRLASPRRRLQAAELSHRHRPSVRDQPGFAAHRPSHTRARVHP